MTAMMKKPGMKVHESPCSNTLRKGQGLPLSLSSTWYSQLLVRPSAEMLVVVEVHRLL